MVKTPIVILLAEDDDDDYLLTKKAFKGSHLLNELYRVRDGQELMDYLRRDGQFQDPKKSPRPVLILLDLNMPRKDGRDALREIKADPVLKRIPVVVLTTSKAEEDIVRSYELGANSFIRKPVEFETFVNVARTFEEYWIEVVELPDPGQ